MGTRWTTARTLGIGVVVALLLSGCGARFDKSDVSAGADQGLGAAPAGPTTTAKAPSSLDEPLYRLTQS